MNNGLPTNHIVVDEDRLAHGYDVTPFSIEEWHRCGESMCHAQAALAYLQAIGMLFVTNNMEAIAALRCGWREAGGGDYAADFNQVPEGIEEITDGGKPEEKS